MSTFVRNFLLAQWTTTVVCIAPGLKMAQMFKLWRLHKYVLYMYCPGQKKEPSWWCTKWYRRICSLILPRCMKSRQLQVGFAHDSAAESSTLIPQYHQILILCISSMVLFLSRVVDGRFCGRKSCQWSYICEVVLPSTVQSLFSLLSRNMGWKVKLKKKKEALHTLSQESYAVWHHFLVVRIWSSTTTVLVLFPPKLTLKQVFTISCCCCLCFVSDVMLACLHNMAVTVSPLRLFIFYVFSNTLSEHLSSFLCRFVFYSWHALPER